MDATQGLALAGEQGQVDGGDSAPGQAAAHWGIRHRGRGGDGL